MAHFWLIYGHILGWFQYGQKMLQNWILFLTKYGHICVWCKLCTKNGTFLAQKSGILWLTLVPCCDILILVERDILFNENVERSE